MNPCMSQLAWLTISGSCLLFNNSCLTGLCLATQPILVPKWKEPLSETISLGNFKGCNGVAKKYFICLIIWTYSFRKMNKKRGQLDTPLMRVQRSLKVALIQSKRSLQRSYKLLKNTMKLRFQKIKKKQKATIKWCLWKPVVHNCRCNSFVFKVQ